MRVRAGAYFCVDASGYDAIGWYLQAGCTKDNRILSVAHGAVGEQDPGAGAFGWCEEVMKEFKQTEGGVEEADKELGLSVIMQKTGVELDDDWLDGDRLGFSSAQIEARCEEMGIDEELGGKNAYKYHPSAAPTHYIICESMVGRKIVEQILNKRCHTEPAHRVCLCLPACLLLPSVGLDCFRLASVGLGNLRSIGRRSSSIGLDRPRLASIGMASTVLVVNSPTLAYSHRRLGPRPPTFTASPPVSL